MSALAPLGALLLLPLAALVTPTLAYQAYTSTNSETPKDNSPNCSCYLVETGDQSNSPEYFQYYRFYDFRNLPDGLTSPPPAINQSQNASLIPTWQPDMFNSPDFLADWGVQNWSKEATADFPTPMANSFANIYIAQQGNGTYLTLRTTKLEDHQTAAEMENQQKNLMHVSMRMSARVRGDSGAVAGFFTFFDDANESDVEILTRDAKDKIRYTNQPSVDREGNEIMAASTSREGLPHWDDWHMHRIDWLPKESYWYLDNKQVAANKYSVPRRPSFMVLNMWSDGGEWSGNMTEGGEAEFQIQWIEMTFNTSGPYTGTQNNNKRGVDVLEKRAKRCQNVCKIDGVQQIGTPEIVSMSNGDEDGDEGLSAGAKAGIAVGVIVGVFLLAAIAFFVWRKRKAGSKRQKEYEMKTKVLGTPEGHTGTQS